MQDIKLKYNQAEHKTNKHDVKIAKIRRDGIVAICKYIVLGIVAICNFITIVLIPVIAVLLYSPPPILLPIIASIYHQ